MVGVLELLLLIGVTLGTIAGILAGMECFGGWGAAGAGLASFWAGVVVARGIRRQRLHRIQRLFQNWTTEDLQAEVMGGRCLVVNVALRDLGSRGVDLGPYLPLVLDLMESERSWDRLRGWAALVSAYPLWAECIPDYPSQLRSLRVCQERVGKLGVLLRGVPRVDG